MPGCLNWRAACIVDWPCGSRGLERRCLFRGGSRRCRRIHRCSCLCGLGFRVLGSLLQFSRLGFLAAWNHKCCLTIFFRGRCSCPIFGGGPAWYSMFCWGWSCIGCFGSILTRWKISGRSIETRQKLGCLPILKAVPLELRFYWIFSRAEL